MLEPWERTLIEGRRVAHLGTVGASGAPHLVAVCFALLGERIVISTDEKPKRLGRLQRLRNIERDPRVTLLFDLYDDDDWTRLAWVRMEGTAAIHARGDSVEGAIKALRARYRQYGSMAIESLPLIEVQPLRVVSWRWTPES